MNVLNLNLGARPAGHLMSVHRRLDGRGSRGAGEATALPGAAPGVGKTYAMLNEGRRREERGTDVVVGWVETHGRAQTEAQIGDLEIFPRRTVEYRGRRSRRWTSTRCWPAGPSWSLVDELAHTNVPGSGHAKRWRGRRRRSSTRAST